MPAKAQAAPKATAKSKGDPAADEKAMLAQQAAHEAQVLAEEAASAANAAAAEAAAQAAVRSGAQQAVDRGEAADE